MCVRCGTQFGPNVQLINTVGLPGPFIPHECDARRAPDAEPRRTLQGKNRLLPRMPALQPFDRLRPSPTLLAKHNVTMMRLSGDSEGTAAVTASLSASADPHFDISCANGKRRRVDSASSFESAVTSVPPLPSPQTFIVG